MGTACIAGGAVSTAGVLSLLFVPPHSDENGSDNRQYDERDKDGAEIVDEKFDHAVSSSFVSFTLL